MPPLCTVSGRDVLFAHWPVDPSALRPQVPEPLAIDTFDGSAWVSALALENAGVAPGSLGSLSVAVPTPQLNFRTYVSHDGDEGVYFHSLDTGDRAVAELGRRAFGLAFHAARSRIRRTGDTLRFSSRRTRAEGPDAVFRARYRPARSTGGVEPGSVAAFCVERDRYFVPPGEGGAALPGAGATGDDALVVGRITREPWQVSAVDATVRANTLFEATGLPSPAADPVLCYSPGFEMGVEPVELRGVG